MPPTTAPPRNKPGALAVLAEIEIIEPKLKRHRQEFAPKFSASLSSALPAIFSQLGLKSPPSPQVGQTLVAQTVSESLQNVGRAQSTVQLQQVVVDAATKSIVSQEEIAGGKNPEQIFEKIQQPIAQIVTQNQKGLEEEAVLAGITQIASLEKPDEETKSLVTQEIQSEIESADPLMTPEEKSQLFESIATYLAQNRESVNSQLAEFSEDNLPSLEQFQEIKEKAHDLAVSQLPEVGGNVDVKELAADIGAELGTKPLDGEQLERFGLGFAQPTTSTFKTEGLEGQRVALSLAGSEKAQEAAVSSLISHDKEKAQEAEKHHSFNHFYLEKARNDAAKKPKEAQKYLTHFQKLNGGTNKASQTVWRVTKAYSNYYPGIFVPQSILNNRVISFASMGSLAHSYRNFSVGNVVSGARGLSSGLRGAINMGKTAKGAVMAGKLAFGVSNPAGWAMLAAQAIPFLKKHAAKIIAGAVGLGILLLLMLLKLLAKLAAIAAGAVIGATIGFVVGGPVGAVVGAVIGGGIGYLAANYLPQVVNFVRGVFSGAAGGFTGAISGLGHLATSAASGAWGALTSAGGGILSGASSLASSILGGLAPTSVSAAAIAVPVAGAVGAVAVGTILVGTITATSFFSLGGEGGQIGPPTGENEFLAIEKTANTTHLDNPGQDIIYTINLTAKVDLTGIRIVDNLKVTSKDASFSLDRDKSGQPLSPIPCQETLTASQKCSYSFSVTTDNRFKDSVVNNNVEVTAIPQGQPSTSANATNTVTIGNPPAGCPRGWPAIGNITQGPEGAFSHASPVYGYYEALDIAQSVGHPVYATVDGTVIESWSVQGSMDQRLGIKPTQCPGLEVVYYWHLSGRKVSVGDVVRFGQEIGSTGYYVADGVPQPHTHYQFNRQGVRSFRIETPYIPQNVSSRDCSDNCGVTITKAP